MLRQVVRGFLNDNELLGWLGHLGLGCLRLRGQLVFGDVREEEGTV